MTVSHQFISRGPFQSDEVGMLSFFSIIVPAYNVEGYLDQCIKSVLDNSFEDYEILLIDDGSTDGTSRSVDEWAGRDARIKAIHRENGGLSAARNTGITVAQGRYIVFLDADDCLAPWALADLFDVIHASSEPDVVITEMSNVQDVSKMPTRDEMICPEVSILGKDKAFMYVFAEKPHTWPAPQYPVKRSFVSKTNLLFLNGILHEDVCWTAEVMASAKSFAVYCHPWYIRRCGRDGSIMSSVSVRHITDTVKAVRTVLESPVLPELMDNQASLLRNRLALSLFPSLRQYGQLDEAAKSKAAACIDENLELFMLSRKPAHRIFVATCKVLGAKRALKLIPAH